MTSFAAILLTLLGLAVADPPAPQPYNPHRLQAIPQFTVPTAIDALAAEDARLSAHAVHYLRNQQADDVIDALLDTLQNNQSFEEPIARARIYGLLKHHYAARDEGAFPQLVEELRHPQGCRLVTIFALTPEHRYGELVTALSPMLTGDRCDEYQKTQLLRVLALTGTRAAALLPEIREFWRDDTLPIALRSQAIISMIQIGGAGWTLDQLEIADPAEHAIAEMVVLLDAVAAAGAATEGTWNDDVADRDRMRTFIIAAMQHEDVEVRRAAATALGYAYSESELVIGDDPDALRINPQLNDAFIQMMASDSDPELRALAREAVTEHFPREVIQARQRMLDNQSQSEGESGSED